MSNRQPVVEEAGEKSPALRLSFDLPTSVNKMYRRSRWGVVLTNDAKAYKHYAGVMALRQGADELLISPLAVTYRFYGSNLDADNGLKVLNDSLNGIVWKDDRQIIEMHIYVYRKEKHDPHVEVDIWELQA